jgi:hypothetical protein
MNGTDTFEDRLLLELQDVVRAQTPAQPGRPHRVRNRSVAGTAVAAAAATVAALVMTGGASAAYAIDDHDGTVTVTIKGLSDAAGLQKALRAKGVSAYVDYAPAGKSCQQPRGQLAGGQGRVSGSAEKSAGLATFSINPGTLKPGVSVVVETTGGSGPTSIRVVFIQGPVAACTLVDAPAVPPPGPGAGSDTHTVTGVNGGGLEVAGWGNDLQRS